MRTPTELMKEGGQNEMTLLCKKNALYVKVCVIANGIADTDGDILNSQEIKEIFTSFNNQDSFEVHHDDLPLEEVSLLENYISTTDETLGTTTIPAGSWMGVIRVDNPSIQERILHNEFGGVSLSNRVRAECSANLTGEIRYKDLPKMDCVIPRFISFVENPANRIGMHIYDYDTYIRKSKKMENENMDMKEFLEGLKSLISKAEEDVSEEPTVEKDKETEQEEDEDAVETVEKEDDEESSDEETPSIKKEEDDADVESEEESDEEESEEKVEKEETELTLEMLNERILKLEEQIKELTSEGDEESDETSEEPTEEQAEENTEESPKITKSRKVIKVDEKIETKNFYEMSGRDPVTGCKIRN